MRMLDRRAFIRSMAGVLLSTLVVAASSNEASARTQQIHNVVDIALPAKPGTTMQQIERAIILAGSVRGWAIEPVAPGQLVATLRLRGHVAVVTISHTLKEFSITYKSSKDLLYRKEGETEYIHRNYNSWIGYLQGDIIRAVGSISQ